MEKKPTPDNILCAKTHEWINEDGIIGITDYAVEQLGDIVFVELPEIGSEFQKNDPFATIESVKAVSEVYAPVSGKIIEINEKLVQAPETVNEDVWNDGWLVKIEPNDFKSDTSDLMEYEDYVEDVVNE